jgi:hypothetical protein
MRHLLIGILALLTLGPWCDGSCAQGLDISLKDRSFRETKPKEPSSAAVFADAVIGRPLGVATTVVGATTFVATLPFTVAPRGGVRTAARALVIKPAGWTFIRPLGGRDPRFVDEGIFWLP